MKDCCCNSPTLRPASSKILGSGCTLSPLETSPGEKAGAVMLKYKILGIYLFGSCPLPLWKAFSIIGTADFHIEFTATSLSMLGITAWTKRVCSCTAGLRSGFVCLRFWMLHHPIVGSFVAMHGAIHKCLIRIIINQVTHPVIVLHSNSGGDRVPNVINEEHDDRMNCQPQHHSEYEKPYCSKKLGFPSSIVWSPYHYLGN